MLMWQYLFQIYFLFRPREQGILMEEAPWGAGSLMILVFDEGQEEFSPAKCSQ